MRRECRPPTEGTSQRLRRLTLTAKPKPQVYVIQVFNGSKQSEEKFGSGEEKP